MVDVASCVAGHCAPQHAQRGRRGTHSRGRSDARGRARGAAREGREGDGTVEDEVETHRGRGGGEEEEEVKEEEEESSKAAWPTSRLADLCRRPPTPPFSSLSRKTT